MRQRRGAVQVWALGVERGEQHATCALFALALLCAVAICSCGGGTSGGDGGSASPPPAPGLVVATPGDGEVAVAWTPSAGAQSYTLYWSNTSPVDIATAQHFDDVHSPHVHDGLTNAATYWYVVTARNGAGESPASPPDSATPSAGASVYDPSWAQVQPTNTLQLDWDAQLTAAQNGAALKSAIQALIAGDRLEVGSGTWVVNSLFSIDVHGTAAAPIWIVAQAGATPRITRGDASQNVVNIGSGGFAHHVCLRGLEVTGGSIGIRLYDCENVWIDQCHVHHLGAEAIAANSNDTAWLYLTRNELDHTSGTGEGLYLGANNGLHVMHDSVVALNHVHDTGGSQGDGIEVKQGSYANWIAENTVHDCNYPCILLYGTGGQAPNLVEKNVCWNSADNVMQVQGEAIVRNNLLMHGAIGFGNHDHQGQVRDLTFVHNTIVNPGQGAQLADWTNRPNMVFANNAVYSQGADAIAFAGGSAGVTLAGNVVYGPVIGAAAGWAGGAGLADFTDVSWDASHRDATPSASGALIGSGDAAWAVADDLSGAPRTPPLDSGCYDGP